MSWIGFALVGIIGFVVLPRLGFALAGAGQPNRLPLLPWLSATLFVVAWYLPGPTLGNSDTFTQHAIGGGAACAIAALYVAVNAGLGSPILRVALAYAVAASLGVGIELLELAYDETQGTAITADSAWDLLANSIGAVLTALVLEAVFRARSPHALAIPRK